MDFIVSPLTKVCILIRIRKHDESKNRLERSGMRVNIYIRQEDEELWAALENKSEWIHEQLNKDDSIQVDEVDTWHIGNSEEV